jgi:hypothetical protein
LNKLVSIILLHRVVHGSLSLSQTELLPTLSNPFLKPTKPRTYKRERQEISWIYSHLTQNRKMFFGK